MRPARPQAAVAFLILVLALAFGAGAGSALAQSSKAAKPRTQVEDVPGKYIQLETAWVPVIDHKGRPSYHGLVVRLWPGPDTRYEACVQAPWVAEALLIHFNDVPIDRDTFEDAKRLNKIVSDVVKQATDQKLYRQAEAFHEFVIPDEDSAMLSNTCK